MNIDEKLSLYKSAAEKITADDAAADRITAAVLSKAEGRNEKIRIKRGGSAIKRIPAMIAAAAVALSLGVVAYAAGNSILSAIFGEKDFDVSDGLTGHIDVAKLETYHDGLEVLPVGFSSDGYITYCVFRLDFAETLPESDTTKHFFENWSTDYFETKNVFEHKIFSIAQEMRDNKTNDIISVNKEFKRISDHSMYLLYRFDFKNQISGEFDLDFELSNLWIRGDYNEATKFFDETPFIDEPLFYADFSIDIHPTEPVDINTEKFSYEDTEISVTPCVVRLRYTDHKRGDFDFFRIVIKTEPEKYILLNDGSKVRFSEMHGYPKLKSGLNTFDMRYEHEYWLCLDYPINTDNIKEVVIEGISMPVA